MMSPLLVVALSAALVAPSLADTPANCTFESIRGRWTFYEGLPIGDSSIKCPQQTQYDRKTTVLLQYPDVAEDEFGNVGTWTLIYNQGFEVRIMGRVYFAFSDFAKSSHGSVTSLCHRTRTGWSHDFTSRNWACFRGQKDRQSMPTVTHQAVREASSEEMHGSQKALVDFINAGDYGWTAREYPEHASLTKREMQRRAGGHLSRVYGDIKAVKTTIFMKRRNKVLRRRLPKHWDWRDVNGVNYVSPVRNQGTCGSCYAFASMAALEARIRILTNNTMRPEFSPQDIVSCSQYSQGCSGGFPYLIAGKYGKDYGFVEERCNPYKGKDTNTCGTDQTCHRIYSYSFNYVGGFFGGCSELQMMQTLVENGPLPVGFEVYPDFMSYSGGIYKHVEKSRKFGFDPLEMTNHAVLVVGYGEENGIDYWIVKNSWGVGWGEKGFFRIQRGDDQCGFESMAMDFKVSPY